jgi:hypothetical protein
MNRIEKFNEAKKELITEILNDNTLSNVKKLGQITELNIWGVSPFVNNELDDWHRECVLLEKHAAKKAGLNPKKDYICDITDDFLYENSERYETVYYMDIISDILDDEDEEDLINEEMIVVTCRGDFNSVLKKKKSEVIDKIAKFALDNEIIGFKLDW